MKVLLNSFHLNGHTQGFHPQTAHYHLYGNEFFLSARCLANQIHFHVKGCKPRPVLKKELKSKSEIAYFLTKLILSNHQKR